jgi:S1-C subfamily serine protease
MPSGEACAKKSLELPRRGCTLSAPHRSIMRPNASDAVRNQHGASRLLGVVCFGVLEILLCGGCTSQLEPTAEDQDASFRRFADARIEGSRIDIFLAMRTAAVITGAATGHDTSVNGNTRSTTLRADDVADFGQGTAVPIDARGYFATASHCFGPQQITLIYADRDSEGKTSPRVVPAARVIWRGDLGRNEPDFAVVCVDRPIPYHFEWGSIPANGTSVVASAMNAKPNSDAVEPLFAGGRVLFSNASKSKGLEWTTIFHDAPIRAGGSGGPVLTLDGRLVGINTERTHAPLVSASASSVAVCPDLGWLRTIIDTDAMRHSVGGER